MAMLHGMLQLNVYALFKEVLVSGHLHKEALVCDMHIQKVVNLFALNLCKWLQQTYVGVKNGKLGFVGNKMALFEQKPSLISLILQTLKATHCFNLFKEFFSFFAILWCL